MKGKKEVEECERRLEAKLKNIKKGNYSTYNKKRIEEFVEYCKTKRTGMTNIDLRPNTVIKHLIAIKQCLDYGWINKNFDKATKDDIEFVVNEMLKKGWTNQTKKSFLCAMKVFWRFLKGNDGVREYPKEVSWINTTLKKVIHLTPEHIFSREDIEKMSQFAHYSRDKAILWVAWSTAARPDELRDLMFSSIKFTSYGCDIVLKGYKGERSIPCVECTEPIRNWLRQHPLKNQEDFPLWVTKYAHNGWSKMEEVSINNVLKNLAKRSKIIKKSRITIYVTRKGRLTEWAGDSKIPIHVLNQLAGWASGSTISRHYIALGQRDSKDAILDSYGLKNDGDNDKKVIPCIFCNKMNPVSNLECDNCHKPLRIHGGELYIAENIDKLVTERITEMLTKLGFKVEESDDKNNYQISKEGELYMEI
jgi:integrase